jgi:preprotein translocase subunit SecA
MFRNLVRKVIGDPVERALAKYREVVERINALEPELQALSDEGLRARTANFQQRLAQGETLDDLLPEAFATVREASVRSVGLRHYDVQMIGGIVLHKGRIAEMKTGEGKTLVATLPLYLNALEGKGAHLITPNDYLSKVGLQTMGPIYHALGLSSAVIQNTGNMTDTGSFMYDPDYVSDDDRYQNLRPVSRREAYHADITYGTNNEFGFDYLRDNMVMELSQLVQRDLNYAIVDEVDNILIDEARTPLIISGPADPPSPHYKTFANLVRSLKPSSAQSVEDEEPDGDYVVDEKDRVVYLTERGVERVERMLNIDQLYHPDHADMVPYLDNSLRAKALYQNDKEYIVQDGQVVIVDEFTGRLMVGRRFSEGLHQAIEAKEGVEIRRENMTMATITFQNFFRMYNKLAGMTGTAATEAEEFEKIYNLEVVAIPTNTPVVRIDHQDLIYATEAAKFRAIVNEIKERSQNGQPVLVGTVAIETSERLSKELKRAGIAHEVLNAKQHEREATIIAQAGQPGAVTIATNMAGRGVDILLGGNPEGLARERLRKQGVEVTDASPQEWESAVALMREEVQKQAAKVREAGGLCVIGTERHEARRIDNQLRGRAGRQGDPGETRFYISLEDDLMKRFGGDRVKGFMSWANLPEDEPIEHGVISRSIAQAQERVEGHNFDIRKRVLEYDDVVNTQRELVYKQRKEIITAESLEERYINILEEQALDVIEEFVEDENKPETWDLDTLHKQLFTVFPVPEHITPETMAQVANVDELENLILEGVQESYNRRREELEQYGEGTMSRFERFVMLGTVDFYWRRHLTDLDVLREGIGLMAIAQRDPLVEYKREAFEMLRDMQNYITTKSAQDFFRIEVKAAQQAQAPRQLQTVRGTITNAVNNAKAEPVRKSAKERLGRNDPCWCGSGKKYKACHYREDRQN